MKRFLINALFVVGLFLYFYTLDFDHSRLNYWILLYPILWFSVLIYVDVIRKNGNGHDKHSKRFPLKAVTGFLGLFLILLASGCISEKKSTAFSTQTNLVPPYVKSKDDIIDSNGHVENKVRFDEFLNKVQQGEDDRIRVVRYTTEGDPILYEYEFKNNKIFAVIDTRRDGYGSREIIHITCDSIKSNEEQESTSYVLDGCTPSGDIIILTIE